MKYSEEQKQKFRDLVAQGKPIKEAAAEAGISLAIGKVIRVQDNRKMRENSPSPSHEESTEEQEENLSEDSVPPPEAGGGGASDGSGARGADGARSALGDDEEEDEREEGGKGDPEEKKEGDGEEKQEEKKENAVDKAEVLVNLSQMLSTLLIWGFAKRKKVELTAKQREKLEWSEAERAELLRYARGCANVLPGIIALLGPYVGLAFYGWLLWGITRDRCEQVAEWGPDQKEEGDGDETEQEEIKDAQWEEKSPSGERLGDLREDW